MADLTPRQIALCVAGAAVVLVLGLGRLGGGAGRATVHVAGAVRRPGVYRMPGGARVEAAVRRAGGPTRRADLGAVNLAAEVQDGRQILVPRRAPGGGVAGGVAPAAARGEPPQPHTAPPQE